MFLSVHKAVGGVLKTYEVKGRSSSRLLQLHVQKLNQDIKATKDHLLNHEESRSVIRIVVNDFNACFDDRRKVS